MAEHPELGSGEVTYTPRRTMIHFAGDPAAMRRQMDEDRKPKEEEE